MMARPNPSLVRAFLPLLLLLTYAKAEIGTDGLCSLFAFLPFTSDG